VPRATAAPRIVPSLLFAGWLIGYRKVARRGKVDLEHIARELIPFGYSTSDYGFRHTIGHTAEAGVSDVGGY
jgi:hypothetical protein